MRLLSAPLPAGSRRRLAAGACLFGLAIVLGLGDPPPAAAQGPLPEGYRQIGYWSTRSPQSEVPIFERPAGVDVATDNTIYIVDRQANRVFHLDSSGRTLQSVDETQVGPLKDVTASAQRVYVLGSTGGAIYSRDLKNRVAWTVTGEGLTFDLARDQVLVSRVVSGEARIQGFDPSGGSLGSWRDPNFSISTAFDLDVGPDGRIFLAADGAIYAFRVGGAGGVTADALFQLPNGLEGADLRAVSVDSAGRVFSVFTSSSGYYIGWDSARKLLPGAPLQSSGLSGAVSLAVGPGGGIVFSMNQGGGHKGLSYQADRTDFKTEPVRWGSSVDASLGLLEAPRRLAVGSGEDAFILDQRSRSQLWTPAGEPRQQWYYPEEDYPNDVGGGGALPCRVSGLKLACHDPAGDWTVTMPDTSWLTAVDGEAGRVAALDLADQKVWIYDRRGQAQGSWPLDAGGAFVAAGDLAMENGRVYLADQTNLRIDVRNAADGARLATVPMPAGPTKLDVSAGMVYVLAKDNRVWKYAAADGSLRAAFELEGVTAPNDIAAGPWGRVYVADPLRDQVLLYEPGGSPLPAPPAVDGTGCKVLLGKTAAPDPVERFQLATVQLRVSGACPLGDGRLDVALIIDESGSMSGATIAAAQNAALTFLSELNPKGAQVAVVSFDTNATVLQPLTTDLRGVVRAIGRLKAGGQTNYVDALYKGRQELTGASSRPGVPRVVVMMTDGKPTTTDGLDAAAQSLKATGATVYTIGLGSTINDDILKNTVASRPDLYYAAPTDAQLALVYRNIARSLSSARLLAGGVVEDELPPDMRYEPGSAFPPPDRIQGRVLTWNLGEVPASGRSISYKVRPQQVGRRPTNVRAELSYEDATGETGKALFPVPEITVFPARNVFLPIAYRNSCKPQKLDVILAIDTSGSMTEAAVPGGSQTKLQAAVSAAQSFLGNMSFPGDQAAIVSFSETARVVQPLTGSKAALGFALNGLSTKTGTRIDRGIESAMGELLGGRARRGNKPVLVLLTDGRPTAGTEAEVVKDAASARGLGFTIFAIGLGPDLDRNLLVQVAGRADQAFFAPDGSALKRIYDQVAGKALCE